MCKLRTSGKNPGATETVQRSAFVPAPAVPGGPAAAQALNTNGEGPANSISVPTEANARGSTEQEMPRMPGGFH